MSEKQKPGSPIEKGGEYKRDEINLQQSDNTYSDRTYDDTRQAVQSNADAAKSDVNSYVTPQSYSSVTDKYGTEQVQQAESVPTEQSEVYDSNYVASAAADQEQYQQEYDQQYGDQQYDPNYTAETYDGQYEQQQQQQQQYDEQQQQEQQQQPYDPNQQYEQYPNEYDGTYPSEQSTYQQPTSGVGGVNEQPGYAQPNQSDGNVGQVYTGSSQPTGGTGNTNSGGSSGNQPQSTTELLQK